MLIHIRIHIFKNVHIKKKKKIGSVVLSVCSHLYFLYCVVPGPLATAGQHVPQILEIEHLFYTESKAQQTPFTQSYIRLKSTIMLY